MKATTSAVECKAVSRMNTDLSLKTFVRV